MSNFASGYIKYINHLEQINDAALSRPQVMIEEVEDSYHEHLRNIARNIVTHYSRAKICMLAGPSSSGKTTKNGLLSVDCKIWDVSGTGVLGAETTLQVGDIVYAMQAPSGEIINIYITKRPQAEPQNN